MRGNSKATVVRTEGNILNDCMVALSNAGATVWRNNVGVLPDKTGRPIRFGLCVGSSDIIGIAPDGKFLAVECKTALGQPTDAQSRFIAVVRSLSLIHISEPTRRHHVSRMPSSA